MSQNYLKLALPDENCDEIFVLSCGYATTDETINSDNWSHVTRGDGLDEMVQYGFYVITKIQVDIHVPITLR